MLYCRLLFFFFNQFFQKLLPGIPSRCQTIWILIRPDILSGLIWFQTVFKGYQQMTLVGRVKMLTMSRHNLMFLIKNMKKKISQRYLLPMALYKRLNTLWREFSIEYWNMNMAIRLMFVFLQWVLKSLEYWHTELMIFCCNINPIATKVVCFSRLLK